MTTQQQAYVATCPDGDGEGITTYEITHNEDTVDMKREAVTPLSDSPSFLAVHPSTEYLYAVQEVEDGAVTAFRRTSDGSLERLNRVSSGAGGPCHCSVHPSGEYLFIAHYTGGAVSVVPIREDGGLDGPSDIIQHSGSSVHPERQTQPHPHSITPGPDGRFLYVPDLGTDEIAVYEFDRGQGTLDPLDSITVHPGAGPRHLAVHPNERFVYLINELDSTITAFERSASTGQLTQIETGSTLPSEYDGTNFPADIHVHPSGEWLYGSNRGHDSIAMFEIDSESGELTSVGHRHTAGEWPRHFALDATGQICFAENQNSDNIVAFRIHESDGTLLPTDIDVENPSPMCLCCLTVE